MRSISVFIIIIILLQAASVFSEDDPLNDPLLDEEIPDIDEIEEEEKSRSLDISGEIKLDTRYWVTDDFKVSVFPEVKLDFIYKGQFAKAVINTDYQILKPVEKAGDIISEAYAALFYDWADLYLGYMKVTWGTGDNLHVLDILNPLDYWNPFKEYNDMKKAEVMFKMNFTAGQNGLFEFAYLPVFNPSEYPEEGRWIPYTMSQILLIDQNYDKPDTHSLEYSQFGIRYTNNFRGFDFGGIYYFGYLDKPSFNVMYIPEPSVSVSYDRLQLFGLEFAANFGRFTTRAEFTYNLTEDYSNDDPGIHNDFIAYIAGFEVNLPLNNMNLNTQIKGSYIIGSNDFDNSDMEYRSDGKYTDNMLVIALSDHFYREKIKYDIDFAYNIEHHDLFLKPGVSFTLKDALELKFAYGFLYGEENTNFGQYSENDFIQASCSFSF
jgi:hypothetical protein